MALGFLRRRERELEKGPTPYEEFRTGLTFEDVREELAGEQRAAKIKANAGVGERMYVTRRTVLGRWREHKLSAYRAYLRDWRERWQPDAELEELEPVRNMDQGDREDLLHLEELEAFAPEPGLPF